MKFVTRPFLFRNLQIAVPIGAELDPYEKFLLPFDFDTWMWILVTFLSATAAIACLKFAKPNIQEFFIGKAVNSPLLNVVMIFFGISQIKSPGRNFARFLLMSFIMFCMIIRTAYQGKMFEFIQMDIRHPEVQTINELIDKNFTFYMEPQFNAYYNESDFVKT